MATETMETLRKKLAALHSLEAFGLASILCATLMILETVWEETLLTWRAGPQNVGFTVAHVFPFLLLFGILGGIGLIVYLLLWMCRFLIEVVRKRSLQLIGAWIALTASLLLGLAAVPYTGWMTVMVKTVGPGTNGYLLMKYAIVDHQWKLAEDLRKRGVSVDSGIEGETLLNASCEQRDLVAARFLLQQGANIATAPECNLMPELTGRSPLLQVEGTSVVVTP